jgi:guanylate kinase
VVVSAPSGTGKTSVVEKLLALDGRMIRAMTATTRPARKGEVDGTDYVFLTEDEFKTRRENGYFAESAEVHGHWYGVPKEHVSAGMKKGKWVVLNVDIQGGLTVKETYPDAVLIFLLPPSMEALEERLRGRGTETEEEIAQRMKNARDEMLVAPRYDYVVVNDDVKTCASRLLAIVWAETSRVSRGLVMPKD